MEARIRELEKAAPHEVIDVDTAAENTMVVFSAIEELRKDTEEGWKKLAVVMDMVIFRTIFFELLVFFTFTLLIIHFAY